MTSPRKAAVPVATQRQVPRLLPPIVDRDESKNFRQRAQLLSLEMDERAETLAEERRRQQRNRRGGKFRSPQKLLSVSEETAVRASRVTRYKSLPGGLWSLQKKGSVISLARSVDKDGDLEPLRYE